MKELDEARRRSALRQVRAALIMDGIDLTTETADELEPYLCGRMSADELMAALTAKYRQRASANEHADTVKGTASQAMAPARG